MSHIFRLTRREDRLDALKEALCEDTILVSVMYVNNEVGTVQPIEEAVQMVKAYDPQIIFHSDAVQGYGKYRIYPKRMGIDLLSASGHKIHGPKGIGFLYIGEKVKITPIVYGGEQQKNIRSGTENVPGIAGLGLASEMIYKDLDMKVALMRELKAYFIEGLKKIDRTVIHGLTDEGSAPHIISAGIAGIRSEVLLHTLEEKRDLCIFRLGMRIQSSGDQRCAERDRSRAGISGRNTSVQICRSLRRKKKLTIHWKHYIIVYRCFVNIHADKSGKGDKKIMKFHSFLIKYGEIGIKGKNRYLFEDALLASRCGLR